MTTAIVIPARYGSQRLPGKPLLKIQGREMLGHVLDRCRDAFGRELPIFVATEDARIASFVNREDGCSSVMTSAACPNGTFRIKEALKSLGRVAEAVDRILHVQGDEPLIDSGMLRELRTLLERPEVDVGTLAAPLKDIKMQQDPNIVKVAVGRDNRALYFSRNVIPYAGPISQGNPAPVLGHIGLYGWKRAALDRYTQLAPGVLEVQENLEQLRWLEHGGAIHVATVRRMPLGVNTAEDLAMVSTHLVKL